jgi:hypothetical protein
MFSPQLRKSMLTAVITIMSAGTAAGAAASSHAIFSSRTVTPASDRKLNLTHLNQNIKKDFFSF